MAGERTREEILALANINPEVEARRKNRPFPDTTHIPILTIRKMFDGYAKQRVAKLHVPENVSEEDTTIIARDGHELACRIHKPADGTRGPLFVVLHGGSMVLGGPWQEYQACREFVCRFGAVCVNADYRLAPEYQFPVATYDVFDVIKWAASNADSLGADASKGFILAGTSAGASLANVAAHLAKDADISPAITGMYLSAPQTISRSRPPAKYKDEYLSWEQCDENNGFSEKVYEVWKPDFDSPLYDAVRLDHSGLPRVYMQACGMDHNRDDALIYEHMLRTDAGVETKLDMYPGLPHVYWLFAPELDISKKAVEDIYKGIAWLLRKAD